jgi:hypothetical protein
LKVADNVAYKDFTLNVVSANSRQVILNGLSADSIDPSSPLKLDTNGQIIIPA